MRDNFASSIADVKEVLLAKSHWNIYYAINVVTVVREERQRDISIKILRGKTRL